MTTQPCSFYESLELTKATGGPACPTYKLLLSVVWHSVKVKIGAAGSIVPTLRKRREEWGIHFHCSPPSNRPTESLSGIEKKSSPWLSIFSVRDDYRMNARKE